jgi:hypothetical protein
MKSNLSNNIFKCFAFILTSFFIAVAFHKGLSFFGYSYPWNTFLFHPGDRFNDFFNSVKQANSLTPYFFKGPALATYFPFAYSVFLIGDASSKLFSSLIFLIVSIFLLFLSIFFYRSYVEKKNSDNKFSMKDVFYLFSSLLFSYPVLFSIDRGNIDLWIAMLCSIYVFSTYQKGSRFIGLSCLAIAISLKGYPLAFLLLLVAKKNFLDIFKCLTLVFLLTLTSTFWMDGDILHIFSGFIDNFHQYNEIYVFGAGSLFASSDLYNAIRLIALFFEQDLVTFSKLVIKAYTTYSFFVSLILAIYVSFVCTENWRRVIAVSLIILIFPNVANDYKLCILIPGLFLLLIENIDFSSKRAVFFLMMLLMIPKSYFFIRGKSISMVINPLLVMLLTITILNDCKNWLKVKVFFKNKFFLLQR